MKENVFLILTTKHNLKRCKNKMEMKKITMKQYEWNIRLTLLFGVLVGMFFGVVFIYKIEIIVLTLFLIGIVLTILMGVLLRRTKNDRIK